MPSSTNKVILDYLLYLSIQSRLRQAAFELSELDFPEHDNDAHRQRQWFDTAYKAEQDKKAVESIVAGKWCDYLFRSPPLCYTENHMQVFCRVTKTESPLFPSIHL